MTAVCKQYALNSGHAMDIKNGSDFDLAVGRKKAWDSILRDKPMDRRHVHFLKIAGAK